MRAEIHIDNQTIYKRVPATEYAYEVIKNELQGYRDWLGDVGISSPTTNVRFVDNSLVFEQDVIASKESRNISEIVQALTKLKFDRYGIDSNPANFLGQNKIEFVDFYPLPVRDSRLLDEEFDYGHEEALDRYFKIGNVLTFYSIRLFKSSRENALESLKAGKNVLVTEYQEIHPREKIRLLLALRLNEQDKMDEYKRAYTVTRYAKSISEDNNQELLNRLRML